MLEWGEPITRAAARIDRVWIRYPLQLSEFADDEALRGFCELLGGGELFSSLSRRRGSRWLQILRVNSDWLFGAEVRFFPVRPNRSSLTEINFALNPTRLRAYKTISVSQYDWSRAHSLLRRATPDRPGRREKSLDGSDNILRRRDWDEPYDVAEFACRYTEAIQELISHQLVDASDPNPLTPTAEALSASAIEQEFQQDMDFRVRLSWRDWTITEFEVYWEFRVEDALGLLNSIAQKARAVSHEVITRYYERPDPEWIAQADRWIRWRTLYNSFALDIPSGQEGVTTVLYAKGRQRLRIETRFSSSLRQLVRGETSQSHCPPNLEGMRRLIDLAIDDAFERTSILLEALEAHSVSSSSPLDDFARLLSVLIEAAQAYPFVWQDVVASLIQSGGVSVSRNGEDERMATYLAQRRIVRRARSRIRDRRFRRYELVERYTALIRQVRTSNILPRA